MRIYLAGKMKGLFDQNFPVFHRWAAKLRAEGHIVFSPAEQDLVRYGDDFLEHQERLDKRLSQLDDMYWICMFADAIAVIPLEEGQTMGKGTKAEIALGECLDLEIIYLKND